MTFHRTMNVKKISSDWKTNPPSNGDIEFNQLIRQARTQAIGWMKLDRKTTGRVRQYLHAQGFTPDVIAGAIQSLIEDAYLDDLRIARRVLASRQGRQAESKAAIKRRMLNLGLAEPAILTALAEAPEDQTACDQLLEARFGAQLTEIRQLADSYDHDDKQQALQRFCLKAARFLSSRGFGEGTVRRSLADQGLGIDSSFNSSHDRA